MMLGSSSLRWWHSLKIDIVLRAPASANKNTNPGGLKVQLNKNLTRKITLLSTTLAILPLVAFLSLTLAPTLTETSVSAESTSSEMSVGIPEVLSLRIVKYNESTGEWDIDTDTVHVEAPHGSFATSSVKVIASTNGAGGYTLSLNDIDNNNALTSPRILDTIPSLSESKTLDNLTDTTEKFPEERWGYSWVKNSDTPSLTFDFVPLSNASASAKQKDSTSELGYNSYLFTLGVRAAEDTPAETYEDQIMFTLVGNPAPTSPLFYRTEYMQNFTPTICNTVQTPLATTTNVTADNGSDYSTSGGYATKVPSTTIKDERDGQTYTIRKLADGNCWMTESLRYGAEPDTSSSPSATPTIRAYTSSDSAKTATTSAGATKLENTLTSSRISIATDCGTLFNNTEDNQTNPSVCIYNANTPNTVDTSYNTVKFGALYNFCAASGGTVCSTESNMDNISDAVDKSHASAPRVSGSICPTNWSLPQMTGDPSSTASVITTGYNPDNAYSYSYDNLLSNYKVNNASGEYTKVISAPLEFVRAGGAWSGSLNNRGAFGYYWSSTPYTSTSVYAYYLDLLSSNVRRYNYIRANGFSVRCVLAP